MARCYWQLYSSEMLFSKVQQLLKSCFILVPAGHQWRGAEDDGSQDLRAVICHNSGLRAARWGTGGGCARSVSGNQ